MAQKVADEQDTDSGDPLASMLLYGDQDVPPSVELTTFPLTSKARQKVVVGHDTEAIPVVPDPSMRTADDHVVPL